ncbi:MAG: hypothetical protein IKO65_07010, partial [Victivallales bacterium]|nr:hypothetical protein [Victivallales bacterium]
IRLPIGETTPKISKLPGMKQYPHCHPEIDSPKAKIIGKLRFRFLSRQRICNHRKPHYITIERGGGYASLFGHTCAYMQNIAATIASTWNNCSSLTIWPHMNAKSSAWLVTIVLMATCHVF